MPLDMQTAIAQYGYVAGMANTHPDIAAKLDQAAREEWDSARFEAELMNTGWYRSVSERRRAIALQQATDPATWQQTVANKTVDIDNLVNSMGLQGVDIGRAATIALENEFSEAQMRTWLVSNSQFRTVQGALTGGAGEIENHVRNTWGDYGLPISDQTVQHFAREVMAGRQTLGGLDNEARNFAKKAYAPFAEQLDAGRNMREIADPYMQTMASTLEMSQGDVKLSDPHVKRALQGKDGQPLSMWEFERTLKDDARWQYTKQAKNETYAVLQQVGTDWGYA